MESKLTKEHIQDIKRVEEIFNSSIPPAEERCFRLNIDQYNDFFKRAGDRFDKQFMENLLMGEQEFNTMYDPCETVGYFEGKTFKIGTEDNIQFRDSNDENFTVTWNRESVKEKYKRQIENLRIESMKEEKDEFYKGRK